jgi:eukaryotic-like serine/threonine-protein kinase
MLDVASIPRPNTTSSFGKYTLLKRIAAGGMGELFLARLGGAGGFERLVVIKRILPHLVDQPELVTMFLDEARTAAQLAHPNICSVYELGEIDGRYYMALEYLEGVTLAELVVASETAPELADPRLLVPLLVQMAEALHHAHTLLGPDDQPLGLVHRDVNPRNMLVTVAGIAKLLDFGVAKGRTTEHETATGAVKGTYEYMSPEQLEGKPLDARCDVFSLGAVAWEALTGRRLFRRPTDVRTWSAILHEPIPSVSHHRPDLPAALAEAIDRALARDRARRPATARELGRLMVAGLGVPPLSSPAIATQIERVFHRELAAQRAGVRDRRATPVAGTAVRPSPRDGEWSDESGPATMRDRPRLALPPPPAGRLARASSEIVTTARDRSGSRSDGHERDARPAALHVEQPAGNDVEPPTGSEAEPPTDSTVEPLTDGDLELLRLSGWRLIVAVAASMMVVAAGALGLTAPIDDVLEVFTSSRADGD